MRCIGFFGSWFVVDLIFTYLEFFFFFFWFFLLYSELKHFCGDLVQAQKHGSSLSILLSENVL